MPKNLNTRIQRKFFWTKLAWEEPPQVVTACCFAKTFRPPDEHGIVMLTSEEKAYLHHWGVKKTLNVFRFVALVCW